MDCRLKATDVDHQQKIHFLDLIHMSLFIHFDSFIRHSKVPAFRAEAAGCFSDADTLLLHIDVEKMQINLKTASDATELGG